MFENETLGASSSEIARPNALQDFCEAGPGLFTVQLPSFVVCDARVAGLLLQALASARPAAMAFAPEYVPEASEKGLSVYFTPDYYSAVEVRSITPGSRIYSATSRAVREAFEAERAERAEKGNDNG